MLHESVPVQYNETKLSLFLGFVISNIEISGPVAFATFSSLFFFLQILKGLFCER